MKKKWLKYLFCFVLLLLTIGYTYYFRPIVDDELYNYGFSFNIVSGLVPYKDFNMIIPPLFNYLLAGILMVFGSKLIVYHVVVAIMVLLIFMISYKSIGKRAFIIYLLLLIYPYAGYNIFALSLLFILFFIEDRDKNDIWEPIIISMMFLTKQTLGLLVIPSLIYSKNKKKTFAIYLVFIFVFLLYLIGNGTVEQFFDYCLFGMFDFAGKNATGIGLLTIVEIIIIIALAYFSYKTKRKDLFFCLMFQIMALPIVNYIHFIISFVPVVYLVFKEFRDNNYLYILGMVGVLAFFISFNYAVCVGIGNYNYLEFYEVDNFMKGRVTYSITDNYVLSAKKFIDNYEEYTPYILGRFSYLMKLNHGLPINKYDIINNGNMGYKGAERYLEEIDNHCKKNKCIFIINDDEASISITVQTNMEILEYVKNNYNAIYNSNTFSVYIN